MTKIKITAIDDNSLVYIKNLTIVDMYKLVGRHKMRTQCDITLHTANEIILINTGYEWNGATIPNIFWRLIGNPRSPKFALASLIHDELYRLRFNRDQADAIFRELLRWAGVDGWRVALMFSAVRIGGHMFYAASSDNNRKTTKAWRWAVKKLYP